MPDEPLTGDKLAQAVALDFRGFFHLFTGPLVKIRFENVGLPRIRGGDEPLIRLPKEMAKEEIQGPERLYFHLLLISHELAHLVHRHCDIKGEEPEDTRALECWADFYSAKVMMALLTYGERVSRIHRMYYAFGGKHLLKSVKSMGVAVGWLVDTVYVEHHRYPTKWMRVSSVCNGVISFLRRELAGKIDTPGWMYVVMIGIFSAPAVRPLLQYELTERDSFPKTVKQIRRWNLEMQGERAAIVEGLKPDLLPFLSLNFSASDAAIESRREEIWGELDRLAVELGDPDMFKEIKSSWSKEELEALAT